MKHNDTRALLAMSIQWRELARTADENSSLSLDVIEMLLTHADAVQEIVYGQIREQILKPFTERLSW